MRKDETILQTWCVNSCRLVLQWEGNTKATLSRQLIIQPPALSVYKTQHVHREVLVIMKAVPISQTKTSRWETHESLKNTISFFTDSHLSSQGRQPLSSITNIKQLDPKRVFLNLDQHRDQLYRDHEATVPLRVLFLYQEKLRNSLLSECVCVCPCVCVRTHAMHKVYNDTIYPVPI